MRHGKQTSKHDRLDPCQEGLHLNILLATGEEEQPQSRYLYSLVYQERPT